jgi:hypothetical protein
MKNRVRKGRRPPAGLRPRQIRHRGRALRILQILFERKARTSTTARLGRDDNPIVA